MATPASRCRLLARAAAQMLPCSARFAHVMHAVTTAVLRLWGCNVRIVASVVLWLWACITRVVNTAVLLWGWYFCRVSCVSCCAHPALPAPGRNWGATTHRRSCLAVQKKTQQCRRCSNWVVQVPRLFAQLPMQCVTVQCSCTPPRTQKRIRWKAKHTNKTHTCMHTRTWLYQHSSSRCHTVHQNVT